MAIIVEAVESGWEDLGVLCALQLINACVGFIEEHNAGNAIAALKQSLAPTCKVVRGGALASVKARELVPGDLVELSLGVVVPADALLNPGDPIQVDQAALTGESLPVTIQPGGKLKMGSSVVRGEVSPPPLPPVSTRVDSAPRCCALLADWCSLAHALAHDRATAWCTRRARTRSSGAPRRS